jgi:glycosyltransferase involved in cell wall biosynthesis
MAARARIVELGLEKKYLLLGFQKNPETLYPALNAFVLSSISEALGSSLLDAMSLGVPVVGTRTGGIQEVLAEGRGLLAPVGDAAAIAQQIKWCLGHPESAQEMASNAKRYVKTEHDVHEMAQKYLSLYAKLIH